MLYIIAYCIYIFLKIFNCGTPVKVKPKREGDRGGLDMYIKPMDGDVGGGGTYTNQFSVPELKNWRAPNKMPAFEETN